jgi:glycosyltransferase involved in cell wall biosynthesis
VQRGSAESRGAVRAGVAKQDGDCRRVTIVELSRNFGHQAALTAGLDLAAGDVVVTLDGDGHFLRGMVAWAGYRTVVLPYAEQQRIRGVSKYSFKRMHLLVPGWSSLMFILLIVGASLMISLGLVGIYVGYIFQEVKRRPVYLVRGIYDDASQARPPSRGERPLVNQAILARKRGPD